VGLGLLLLTFIGFILTSTFCLWLQKHYDLQIKEQSYAQKHSKVLISQFQRLLSQIKLNIGAPPEKREEIQSLRHTPTEFTSKEIPLRLNAKLKELMRQNRKIEAIKQLRSYTGWGLRESKNYIEQVSKNKF
jgi:ribosomal protein L7/L12